MITITTKAGHKVGIDISQEIIHNQGHTDAETVQYGTGTNGERYKRTMRHLTARGPSDRAEWSKWKKI